MPMTDSAGVPRASEAVLVEKPTRRMPDELITLAGEPSGEGGEGGKSPGASSIVASK